MPRHRHCCLNGITPLWSLSPCTHTRCRRRPCRRQHSYRSRLHRQSSPSPPSLLAVVRSSNYMQTGNHSVFVNTVVRHSSMHCSIGSRLLAKAFFDIGLAMQPMPQKTPQQGSSLGASAKEVTKETEEPYRCVACRQWLSGQSQWNDHVLNKKHQKNQEVEDEWWKSKGVPPPW